jgi:hypothetical protein
MPAIDTTHSSNATIPTNADALESAKPELMKIPATSLRPINLDIPTIILTIMGALGALRALRALIAAVLGEAQAVYVDKLLVYVQATSQAHTDYLIALSPTNLQEMSDELVTRRDVLVSEATTLVKRKLIRAGELGELRGNVGFTNQIFDVFQVVTLLRKHWADVEPNSGVTLAELDAAERLAQRFTQVLADREKAASQTGELAEMRQRAYTGLLDTWDQVRRAVIYLRWNEGDAENIAPSLWAGRSRRPVGQTDGPTPVIAAPGAPSPSTPVVSEPAAPPVAPGLPGNSPFITR